MISGSYIPMVKIWGRTYVAGENRDFCFRQVKFEIS